MKEKLISMFSLVASASCLAGVLLVAGCGGNAITTDSMAAPESVRVVRDEWGVPHIYSDSIYGLYYGYGFAIGQDRLFQLEMARRSTQGTVAEVFGPDYVDYDVTARTLFSPESIRRQMSELSAADRDVFNGYAVGLNAWIDEIMQSPETLLPKQFADLDFMPGRWSAYDVAMIFIGTMNNRYGDFNSELENAAILDTLIAEHGEADGRALFELLNPRFTDDALTTIPRDDWSRTVYDSLADAGVPANPAVAQYPSTAALSVASVAPPSGFSNAFILGTDKAVGANSILVNGPQFGWFNPAYVYSVGMHGAGIDVVGNTPFGYPMILFGHNQTIAWGSTWGASDIVDMFAEQLNPNDSGQYRYNGEYIDFDTRVEEIVVKGEATQTVEIRRSVHGPIVQFEPDAGIAYAKKRSWDGNELETLLAWLHSTWAADWDAWTAEAEKFAINVNWYFADVDGNIGYFHGGRFPERVAGHDNRFPVTGDGSMDWAGFQDADSANPHVLNPSSGFIANWNNKPGHGVMNPEFFYYSWTSADRVAILQQALAAQDQFTPDEAWALLDASSHADVYAEYFLPIIDRAAMHSGDAELIAAGDLLRAWTRESRDADGDGVYDEEATALFRAFVSALLQRTLSDDLGAAFSYFASTGYPSAATPTGAGTNLQTGLKAIIEAIEGQASFDVFNGRPAERVVTDSLRDALQSAQAGGLPAASRPFLTSNFLGIPQANEDELLTAPLEQNRGTENNMIVMQPGAIIGWEVTPPGQSGFIAPDGSRSEHYDDQFELYYEFGRKRTWFYPADVEAHKVSETILTISQPE